MDFSVDLLHTMEKDLNTEIVKLMKAIHVSSVSDMNPTVLQKLNKAPLSDFLSSVVKLLDSNMNLCKAAASSLDEIKTKVVETQSQLIDRQQEEISTVKKTVQTEIRTWADVAKKNVNQDRQLTTKSVKEAVKAVNEEEERSKNLIIYGVKEIEEGDWEDALKIDPLPDLLRSICEQTECLDSDVINIHRIGNKSLGKMRPIKTEFKSSYDVMNILKNAHKLKSNDELRAVYLAPDRTLEQRVAHSKLVTQMKELIKKDSS